MAIKVLPRRGGRSGWFLIAVAATLLTAAGSDCDSKAFRQTATGPIGDGIKTIMGGVVDGLVASVKEAGDGSSSQSTTPSQ